MNKNYLLIAFLISSLLTYGQEGKKEHYIEVTVLDTLLVAPDLVEYGVKIQPREYVDQDYLASDSTQSDLRESTAEWQRRAEELDKKLLKLFKQQKLSYQSVGERGMLVLPKHTRARLNYRLRFDDIHKLSAFYQQIKNWEGIESEVLSKQTSKREAYGKQLTERLISKAKARAAIIAQASGVKLGVISQVIEGKTDGMPDLTTGGRVIYPPLNASAQEMAGDDSLFILLQQTLTVRFQIEN